MSFLRSWGNSQMLWRIETPTCSIEQFDKRTIAEVLYDFDGPKIFTTSSGSLTRLWYECAEDIQIGVLRYLVVPVDDQLIAHLKNGTRTVYDALQQPWIWAVDVDESDNVTTGWVVRLEEVPDLAKPERSALLWPQLEPLISYRLIGDGLREGNVPASVAARAMERPVSALKRLLEAVSNTTSPQGRPVESIRKSYDLPAQRIAFNSFEVSFGMPNEPELPLTEDGQSIYQVSATRLGFALSWLESSNSDNEPDISLLEVLKELVPPAHGQVTKAEVRGQLVLGHRCVVLTRADRTKVTRAIGRKKGKERELLRTEGRIGEFDKDHLSFILRDRIGSAEDLKCTFTEEQFDDLYEAFDNDRRVVLLGKLQTKRDVLEVVAAEPVPVESGGSETE